MRSSIRGLRSNLILIINFQYLDEETSLWWASKEFLSGKLLSDYCGKNEKTKIVILTKFDIKFRLLN